MLETRVDGHGGVDADSLFADLVGLRPLHWAIEPAAAPGSPPSFAATRRSARRADRRGGARWSRRSRRARSSTRRCSRRCSACCRSQTRGRTRRRRSRRRWAATRTLPTRLSVIGEDRVRLPGRDVRLLGRRDPRGRHGARDSTGSRSAIPSSCGARSTCRRMGGAQLVTRTDQRMVGRARVGRDTRVSDVRRVHLECVARIACGDRCRRAANGAA